MTCSVAMQKIITLRRCWKLLKTARGSRSSVSYSLTYSSIDDIKNPHDGLYGKFIQEFAGLGGDAKYVKTTFKGNYYQTLSQEADIVGLLGVGAGYIHEFGDDGVRIFDLFKNSSDIIRGFKFNGIGPYQDAKNGKRYWMGEPPISAVLLKFSSRCRSFLKAWVCVVHSLPTPLRFTAMIRQTLVATTRSFVLRLASA